MATVTVFTSERMKQIEDNTITNADIIDGELIFQRYDGSTFNAGPVNANAVLSVQGDWDIGTAYNTNDMVNHSGSTWIASEGTAAGEEPGVSAKWQQFVVTGTTPDVTNGDHNIAGTLTFAEPPVVPSAENVLQATNLGDVQTELAQLPTLLSDESGIITFQDNLGDIEPVVTGYLSRNLAYVNSGVIFKHENTVAESAGLLQSPFDANLLSNNDRIRVCGFADIKNDSGADVTVTIRMKTELDGGTIATLATSNIVVPTATAIRGVTVEMFMEPFNLFEGNNFGTFGGMRVMIGAPLGSDTDVLANRIVPSNNDSSAFHKNVISKLYYTVQFSVAHANISWQGKFGLSEFFLKEAFPF